MNRIVYLFFLFVGINPIYSIGNNFYSTPPPCTFKIQLKIDSILKCNSDSNGKISISINQGKPPLHYLWSNGDTNSSIAKLKTGYYKVIVTDSARCKGEDSIWLLQPPKLKLKFDSVFRPLCNRDTNGYIKVLALGGVGPYNFNWNTGKKGAEIRNLRVGYHSVKVNDFYNCTASVGWHLIQNDPIPPTIKATPKTIYLNKIGNAQLSWRSFYTEITDNCGGVFYRVNPSVFDCRHVGVRKVLITAYDTIGNKATDTVNVTVIDNVKPWFINPEKDTIICLQDSTSIFYQYRFPNYSGNCGASIQFLSGIGTSGRYPIGINKNIYRIFDKNGNERLDTIIINVGAYPEIDLGEDKVLCGTQKLVLEIKDTSVFQFWFNDSSFAKTFEIPKQGMGKIKAKISDKTSGCSSQDSVDIEYNTVCVGLNNLLPKTANVGYYPNPNQGVFSLKAINLKGTITLKVRDCQGKLIAIYSWTEEEMKQEINIDLSNFKSGIYILQLEEQRGFVTHKIHISN